MPGTQDETPSPGEIERECRLIRETWSEAEHWARAGFVDPDSARQWTPPVVGDRGGGLGRCQRRETG